MSMTRPLPHARPIAPVTLKGTQGAEGPPCHDCAALCCRYYALEIETPETLEDFEALKWYLIHGKSWIWVEDGEWHLQVDEACRYLGPNNECLIYERRPKICRDYGMPEQPPSDDPLCDYFAQDERHDLEFRTLDELERHIEKFAAQRRRRSEAARRGWAKRRQRRL
ncbi:MAG: YkgJ family cysteine cluster protein [Acidobacteriota bacterium]|nr:MAG: YkgJ family cysteine cluster protein [Acidobacteriota bacterium]